MTRRGLLRLLPAPLAGQDRQQRGRQIVDAMLEALGGARFAAVEDRIERGRAYSFYRERLSGLSRASIYTRYLVSPEKADRERIYQRERQTFGKDEDYAILFDEEKAWSITYRGAAPLPPATLARYRETTRRNIFYILRQRLREPGLMFEFQRSEVFENQPVDVVDITDSDNLTVTVFVHQSTRLPIRQFFVRRDPATRERFEEVTRFGKYRDVGGGVQWPFAITRYRNNEKIFEIFSESVTINQGLSDQLFALPGNIKILPMPR